MPKRLFLSHTAEASGAELALLRLTKCMDRDKTTVLFAADGPLVSEFRRAGIDVHVVQANSGSLNVKRGDRSVIRLVRSLVSLISYGWKLGALVRDSHVTVVVAYSVKSMIYGAIAARRARVPLVWSVHDRIAVDYFGISVTFILRVLGRLLPQALIVNSKSTLATICAAGKPTLVLAPGIETNNDQNVRSRDRPLKRVAMIGRLSPWKGQMQFIEAFEQAFSGSTVEAVVVGGALFGEEAYEKALMDRVASGTCSGQIHFTGAIEDVKGLLDSCEVLVHASIIPEPFGAVVVEGLDAGCAVIATYPGGPAEVITDGVDGLLVPCGDINALAEALQRLYQDGDLREKLSCAGIARSKDYDVALLAREAEGWLELLERRK